MRQATPGQREKGRNASGEDGGGKFGEGPAGQRAGYPGLIRNVEEVDEKYQVEDGKKACPGTQPVSRLSRGHSRRDMNVQDTYANGKAQDNPLELETMHFID